MLSFFIPLVLTILGIFIWYVYSSYMVSLKEKKASALSDLALGDYMDVDKVKLIDSVPYSLLVRLDYYVKFDSNSRKVMFKKFFNDVNYHQILSENVSIAKNASIFEEYLKVIDYTRWDKAYEAISENPNLDGSFYSARHNYRLNWSSPAVYNNLSYSYIDECLPYIKWNKFAKHAKLINIVLDKYIDKLRPYIKFMMSNPRVDKKALRIIYGFRSVDKINGDDFMTELPVGAVSITDDIYKVGDELWIKCEGGYQKDV